jgi:hypothetical protein
MCYAAFLIVFQFWNVVSLWMLLTGSGDEFCGLLSALFQAIAYHPPSVGPSAFPVFVFWKFMWRSAPCFSPLLWCAQSTLPCLLFSFVFWGALEVSLSRGECWFIPGVAVGIPHAAYLLTCWSASPKQVWIWHLAVREPSCFLSVMWCGEGLYRLGVQSFDSSWWIFFWQVWLYCLSKIFNLWNSQSSPAL